MPCTSTPTPPSLAGLAAMPDDAVVGVEMVARLLSCSTRHVWRLADARAMPSPLRLGALRRWRLGTIRAWLRDGAPPAGQGAGR